MMKVLIIAGDEWNDYVYGNNVLTNWFTGFDAEFAEIYCGPGVPLNDVCDKYFRITDAEMAKSLICNQKAGTRVEKVEKTGNITISKIDDQRRGMYGLMKKVSLKFPSLVYMLRDFIWLNGKYDVEGMKAFVDDFNPDIVFCPRRINPQLIRLEHVISQMTDAPFVAFTGDDELADLNSCKLSLFSIRNRYLKRLFSKHVGLYSHYLMHSKDQAEEYMMKYGVDTSTIFECCEYQDNFTPKNPGMPIRLVYAGRLYCNRWRSLAKIGEALRIINKDGIRMELDIYTHEEVSSEQKTALSEDNYIYLKGRVTAPELKEIYEKADIALHVESMDKKFKLVTRTSFSTKICDLMASTCAILALCWEKHLGYQFLKENDAAFCVSNYNEILPQLTTICDNPSLIGIYAKKAFECGKSNLNRQKIQNQMMTLFNQTIQKGRK